MNYPFLIKLEDLERHIAFFSERYVKAKKLESVWLVNDEAENLALLDIIKTHDADEAVGVLRLARLHFIHDFVNGGGVKQRQLPQRPVVLGRFRRFAELYAGNVTLVKDVLKLSVDLSIGERRQVRKGFVTTLFR